MMNPHFIFNSLGSIQNFLLHNKPYEAGIYLSQFARLIRQNLNAIDTSMINLEEEITRMKNYFDLEKLRLGDKFDYSIIVNDVIESEDVLIPSMIIQPFAENAIWHGIANLEGKGFISITFRFYTKNSLHIVIEDSGIGFRNAEKFSAKKDSHLNMGMNIVRKRLILLGKKYGIETGVTAVDKSPGSPNPGTRVTIVVPFIFGATGSYLE
jgi:LytS/YehU family sensor histidine kinase